MMEEDSTTVEGDNNDFEMNTDVVNMSRSPPKLDTSEFEEISSSQVPPASSLPTTMGDMISPPAPLPDFAQSMSPQLPSVPVPQVYPLSSGFSAPTLPDSTTSPPEQIKIEEDVTLPTSGGLFGWLNSNIVTNIVEKTKSGIETVITTVDPGMREYLRSGGEMRVLVASTSENKVGGVKDAFQTVFGHATVVGEPSQSTFAPQPVGTEIGYKACQERITNVENKYSTDDYTAIVAVENFLFEMLPDQWFDVGCVCLRDPLNSVDLVAYTTAVPLPAPVIAFLKGAPNSSPSGFSTTVGEAMVSLGLAPDATSWHEHLAGVTRRSILAQAVHILAMQYKTLVNVAGVSPQPSPIGVTSA